jgi:hypothetical protein
MAQEPLKPNSEDRNATVAVPLWALRFVIENGIFTDQGPWGEGWRSDKMVEATHLLSEAAGLNEY